VQKYKKCAESRDYLKDLFPMAGSLKSYSEARRLHESKSIKLTKHEIDEFMVPADIVKANCGYMTKMKGWAKNRVLAALGVTMQPGKEHLAKVSW
jgi:hypothetical protein